MNVLFKPTQGGAMFNNVDSTNVVTNTNGEEVTISPGYYALSEIIAILNTMSNTTFSISTLATSYGCIWIHLLTLSISVMHLTFVRYLD